MSAAGRCRRRRPRSRRRRFDGSPSSSGIPRDCGGLLVSGGNMANFVCFLAARAAQRRLGRARARALPRHAPQLVRIRIRRDAHLDSEGDRSRRASAPRRFAGFRPTTTCAWTCRTAHGSIEADVGRRPRAVHRHRHRGIGQHRRRRSAAADRARVPRAGDLVPCRWRLWRLCRSGAGRARGLACA